jgi:arginine deiminase
MPYKQQNTNPIKTNEFHITHQDMVFMMNDADVFAEDTVVEPDQVFELYVINQNGKEIFLKEISVKKTLSIAFTKNNTATDTKQYRDIDVVKYQDINVD